MTVTSRFSDFPEILKEIDNVEKVRKTENQASVALHMELIWNFVNNSGLFVSYRLDFRSVGY